MASKLVEGLKTPACQVLPPPPELELELEPKLPLSPPPPHAESAPNIGSSNTLNLKWLFTLETSQPVVPIET
jgi:hypothetical protein